MDNITTSKSISAEELQEESNLIIYIAGLILLIVWKVTMICQVRLHRKHNRLKKLVKSRRYQILWQSSETMTATYNTQGGLFFQNLRKDVYKMKYSVFLLSVWYSQSRSMVNVFGDSVVSRSGNLQVAKKVVATVGLFKDYIDEIRQSYLLGFTLYRLHTNVVGVFVTPIRVYSGRVFVLDDVATMEIGGRRMK